MMIIRRVRPAYMTVAAFLCFCVLSACGQAERNNIDKPDDIAVSDPPGANAPLIREDDEGLVQVSIKNGEATISFNLERWDAMHDIYSIASEYDFPERLAEGPFPIGNLSGMVKDACVGKVAALDSIEYGNFILPSVMLLMEDGRVEWALANPFTRLIGDVPGDTLYSIGTLPWLKDIVSFAYESEVDGTGDMTIYAVDSRGLRYDVRIPYGFIDMIDAQLLHRVELGEGEETAAYILSLTLSVAEGNKGAVILDKLWEDADSLSEAYVGTYEITLAENAPDGRRPGLITFDLKTHLISWAGDDEDISSYDIRGTYFAERGENLLALYLSDGDPLHTDQYNQPIDYYEFRLQYHVPAIDVDTTGMNDEELIDYLAQHVPEVYERIVPHDSSMSALVTGETTMIEALECRDVWLGTNLDGKFTREILYTISPFGLVYQQDPVYGDWNHVY